MRRFALVFLVCCSGGAAKQESVTVVAPATKECPPNTVFNGVECAELLSHAPSIDAGSPVAAPMPDHPELTDEARDLRKASKMSRSPALLATEIQALEQLRNASAQTAPDYPQIVRRLAEDYSELGYGRLAQGDKVSAIDARKKAIAAYSVLVDKFQTYASLDEVLYYLGYTQELLGDGMSARRTYYTLIQKYPSSKWIPYAYYAFGEMFFSEAKSDPSKWQLATQAYNEVLKFSSSNVVPWALLRSGQTSDAQGDHARAQSMWAKLKRDYPQSPAAAEAP